MSFLRRFLGLPERAPEGERALPPAGGGPPRDSAAPGIDASEETATVRRIVAQLEALPPERARFLACMAYVLSRAANADLTISPEETAVMHRTLAGEAGVSEAEAVIVVETARQQALLFGSTEDYLVTRELLRISTPEQRLGVLRACFLVAAADDEISSPESAVLNQIAAELQVPPADFDAVRSAHREQLSAVRAIRAVQAD